MSWALRKAAAVGITSVVPSGKTARTSRARIDSFTFSLRFCRRGGKFLPGYIGYAWFSVDLRRHAEVGGMPDGILGLRIGMVRKRDKRKFRHLSVHQTCRRS